VGYESSVWAVLAYSCCEYLARYLFSEVCPAVTAAERIGLYFIAVAMTGIGMLTLTGNNVAMDSFGPIADNANGNRGDGLAWKR